MTSAIVTVNTIPLATSGVTGFNATAGSTITVALADTSNVISWSINCTSFDGYNPGSLPATINATKIQNNILYQATFVVPSLYSTGGIEVGSANQFVSIVNQGQADQQTFKFGIFVLGSSGRRMFFPGETTESNITVGVVFDMNVGQST